MPTSRSSRLYAALCALLWLTPAHAATVLMVSVDGMKPEYVLDADAHGLRVPFLRSLVRDGSYARGVLGVWPTVTYPSHTTLVTGVSPAEHGITSNLEFDPRHTYGESWFWYAPRIRVPTLWQAAHAAGLSTASLGWPVSVDAPAVDTLIPEFWRINRPTPELAPSDGDLIGALSRPAGLLAELEPRLGPYMGGNDPSPTGDVIRAKYALEIIRTRKPRFMTVHLSALDEQEHAHAPFSAEANQELEVLDGFMGEMAQATRANDPDAAVVVVSDHGFLPLTARINLYPAFVEAGLLSTDEAPGRPLRIVDWQATLWVAGGMAAVMVKHVAGAEPPSLKPLLERLKADPRFGIADILDAAALRSRGGFPEAAYLIVMRPGFYLVNDPAAAPVVTLTGPAGGHGFSPDEPAMRAAFFAAGRGIARHRDLGLIDMRQIAPSVAQLLAVKLPSAGATPLPLKP